MRRALVGALVALACSAQAQAQTPAPSPIPATGTIQLAFTPWDDAEGLVLEAIQAARGQIFVHAFVFTNRRVAAALIAAKRRGLRVEVTVDREQAFSAERSRIPELAAAGIPVWLEVRYAAAHNKVMIIDPHGAESAVLTGSFNWTPSAQRRNAENLVVFRRNRAVAQAYLENWERLRADALPYAASRR